MSNLAVICLLLYIISLRCVWSKRVMCYYAKGSKERSYAYTLNTDDIDVSLCTHLVYACSIPDLTDGLLPTDLFRSLTSPGDAMEFAQLKSENKDLKLVLSIGGWKEGSVRFSRIASRSEEIELFARQSVDTVRYLGFDGFEINWQWPGLRHGGSTDDKKGLLKLIQALKAHILTESNQRITEPIQLSLVLPPFKEIAEKGYDLQQIKKEVDYLVLMTMDYYLPTDPYVNHHAPLYSTKFRHCNQHFTVAATVQYYLDNGVDPDKMILGIPLYGNSYVLDDEFDTTIGADAADEGVEGFGAKIVGNLAYFEICKYVRDFGWNVRTPNHTAMGPYAYQINNWVAYDDPHIITQKVKFALEKCLEGVMLWTIDMDDFKGLCHDKFPLTKAAKKALIDFDGKYSCPKTAPDTTEAKTWTGPQSTIPSTTTSSLPITTTSPTGTTSSPTGTTSSPTGTTTLKKPNEKPFKMVKREKWGAKPPTETINNLRVFPPAFVIIGHTVSQQCSIFAECKSIVKNTQDFHMSLDFGDIGYNFLIGGDGNVYEGLGWNKYGAHTYGFNYRSLGIVFIGDFSKVKPPEKQVKAAQRLIAEAVSIGQLSPNYKVFGQRQVISVLSPGDELMALIKSWPHWAEYDPIEDDED